MKTTHTPGPWYTGINAFDAEKVFQGGSGVAVMSGGRRSQQEREANAALIAAAPDMYAVLKELEAHETDDWQARRLTLRAAIAKAEGGAK